MLIDRSQFSKVSRATITMDNSFGFFAYKPRAIGSQLTEVLDKTLASAELVAGAEIDIVVLPELALCEEDIGTLEASLARRGVGMYVAGAYTTPQGSNPLGNNRAHVKRNQGLSSIPGAAPVGYVGRSHDKHHRWLLDARQIVQYGLQKHLNSKVKWWEAIAINQRSVQFFATDERFVISTLICEDLARQDPVAEIVRAVGPSLVIALLMDGPQLANRWSARYAGVLAEDPGSSVLTVTSLGMVRMSTGPHGSPSSRAIALWTSPDDGQRVIEIEPGAIGVVLPLTANPVREYTADGRLDDTYADRICLPGSALQVRINASLPVPLQDPTETSAS